MFLCASAFISDDICESFSVLMKCRCTKNTLPTLPGSSQKVVIVEAKNADLERGFNQLAVELIAMAQYRDEQDEQLYGTVTIGDMWRFGMLDRDAKRIVKDIDSFRIPLDLDELFRVFLGVLQ
ncbi:MAG: hypothetical protein DRQ49_17765 [Gammaproteobacteria bacterium]|nr:MAG: hypothetical protein DRQ49_17765 [Gammaproteobacteria bacterium]RKZ75414.1 MAG: hypothetical protein DRQ57_07490 [Gammaproteobacteria bacterium]